MAVFGIWAHHVVTIQASTVHVFGDAAKIQGMLRIMLQTPRRKVRAAAVSAYT